MKEMLSLFLCTVALTSLSDCDRDEPKTELEKLPPITQEGKNTFGCLVNDIAWVTKTSIDAYAVYQVGFLTVSAVLRNPNFDQGITFTIVDANLKEGDINLSDSTKQYVAFGDAISNCQLISDGITGSGIFTITKFDKHKRIVSGIFHFQLDKVGCQSIQATEGRFDLTLTL